MSERDDDLLFDAFADLRREVAPHVRPAGTAAAHATVRHRKRVRATVATVTAAIVFAVPAVAYAISGDSATPPAPPVGRSAEPTPEQTTPSPSPSPSPSTGTGAGPKASAGDVLPQVPGKVFYLDWETDAIHADGKRYPGGNSSSVNVSPDGKRVTWVDDDGRLWISDLDGDNRRELYPNADLYCVEPVWSADSSRLLFGAVRDPDPIQISVMYFSGGAGDHLGDSGGCHYRWSADGRRVAYLHGNLSGVTVANLDGTGKRVLTRTDFGGRLLADLTSISADGGMVCVTTTPADGTVGDVGRVLSCDTVVDVAKNKTVTLPVTGQVRAVLFQPDGGMLVRVRDGDATNLILLDADGQMVARTAETAETAKLSLLAYTPE